MKNLFVRFVREEEGQDLIEYSLLAAIIAVGSIVAMGLVSDELDLTFDAHRDRSPDPVVAVRRDWERTELPSRRFSFTREEFISHET